MHIGEVARVSGLPVKTIRYYEEIGLIKPLRELNRYRTFRHRDMRTLVFLGCARSLGFKIQDYRNLIELFNCETGPSEANQEVAEFYRERIQQKIGELEEMRKTLTLLINSS